MLTGHTGGCSLFSLAVIISGVHLQRNDSSVQLTSEGQIYRPILEPSEATPQIGTYILKNQVGEPCIKATMGVEYIVIEKKKTWYFNLEPSRVRTSGHCGQQSAVLCLTLPDNATSLQLTFTQMKNLFSVTTLTARVSPLPVCPLCANKTYSGLVSHEKLFTAANGQSFKCKSESLLVMSSELRIKLVPLQIQAFTLPKGQYGTVVECWADYNKRVIPVFIGATVLGLILMAVLTHLFIRDRRRQGYDRL
ncbi:lysosome-associated membrane glycoprotein 3 [Chelmon rostratus]|uniref:lysosome-associated membrane glycoprotein 3 n=1 Tax=Chelmon rostratus TaxID=109905 RepID=UPI001BE71918|nr:lysosome-associated membrane glycoprotein 3 [Chelmon rostratus]